MGQGAIEMAAKQVTIEDWKKYLIPGKLYEHHAEGGPYPGPFMFVKFQRQVDKYPLVFLDTRGKLRYATCTTWAPPDIFWKRVL